MQFTFFLPTALAALFPLLLPSCGKEATVGEMELAALAAEHDLLLPSHAVSAVIMRMEASPRLQDLLDRFKEAGAQNLQWWMQYLAEYQDLSGALPYHPNMGLSQAEYDEMLEGLDSVQYTQFGQAKVRFQSIGAGKVRMHSKELGVALSRVTLDFSQQKVTTVHGDLDVFQTLDVNPEDSALGAWKGLNWKTPEPEIGEVPDLISNFSLGRRAEDGAGLLIYRD